MHALLCSGFDRGEDRRGTFGLQNLQNGNWIDVHVDIAVFLHRLYVPSCLKCWQVYQCPNEDSRQNCDSEALTCPNWNCKLSTNRIEAGCKCFRATCVTTESVKPSSLRVELTLGAEACLPTSRRHATPRSKLGKTILPYLWWHQYSMYVCTVERGNDTQ